jgi:hypothetical protein
VTQFCNVTCEAWLATRRGRANRMYDKPGGDKLLVSIMCHLL